MRKACVLALGMGLAIPWLPGLPADAAVQGVIRTGLGRGQSQDSYNRDVRFHNQTGWTMTALQASASDTGSWGADLLRSASLGPGDSRVITVDDGSGACLYDVLARFENGESLRRNGVNVCQVADYYFTR